MAVSVTEMRSGMAFKMGNDIFQCIEYAHQKMAQRANVRLKMRNLLTGSTIEKTFNVDEKVEKIFLERRQMQYLYAQGDEYFFMDQNTFDQISLRRDVLKENIDYLKEGDVATMVFYDERPLGVELPTSVELKVTETDPGFKGDTVSGGSKPATMETGLTVKVPLFINIGEKLKIDTRSGQYISRV